MLFFPTVVLVSSLFISSATSFRYKRGGYGRPMAAYSPPQESSYSPPTYSAPLPNYASKNSYQPPETGYAPQSSYSSPQSGYSRPSSYGPPQNYQYQENYYGGQQNFGNYGEHPFQEQSQYGQMFERPYWARQRGPQIPWWKRQQFMNQGYPENNYPGNFEGPQPPQGKYPQNSPAEPPLVHRPAPPFFPVPSNPAYSEMPKQIAPVMIATPPEIPVSAANKEKEYPEVPAQNGPPPGPPPAPSNAEYPETNPPPPPPAPEYPEEANTPAPSPPSPPLADPVTDYPTVGRVKDFTLPPQAQVPDIPDPPGK